MDKWPNNNSYIWLIGEPEPSTPGGYWRIGGFCNTFGEANRLAQECTVKRKTSTKVVRVCAHIELGHHAAVNQLEWVDEC